MIKYSSSLKRFKFNPKMIENDYFSLSKVDKTAIIHTAIFQDSDLQFLQYRVG